MLGAVVDTYNESVPINTEIEDKRKQFKFEKFKYFVTLVHHLPRKGVGGEGGFGLRKKSWKFGILGWGGGILELWIWT